MRIQAFAEVLYSVFVKRSSFKRLLNLRKAYIFQEFAEGLLSISVGCSAVVVSQSKSTELCSSAAFMPQIKSSSAAVVPQSKSTELCTCSSAAVVPQSKSTEM